MITNARQAKGVSLVKQQFNNVVDRIIRVLGTPAALAAAALVIVVWAVTGPLFGFSDTWQLVINTGTTIVTFLMVFVIQNAQNRDAKAVHIKLDELIRAVEGASNRFVTAENLTEEQQDKEIKHLINVAKREARTPEAAEAIGKVEEAHAKTDKSRAPANGGTRARSSANGRSKSSTGRRAG